eukprot:10487797-Alexandrium_andersonii.AAC.1
MRKEAGGNPRHPGELVRGPSVWATSVLRIGPKDPKDRPLIEVRQILLREVKHMLFVLGMEPCRGKLRLLTPFVNGPVGIPKHTVNLRGLSHGLPLRVGDDGKGIGARVSEAAEGQAMARGRLGEPLLEAGPPARSDRSGLSLSSPGQVKGSKLQGSPTM